MQGPTENPRADEIAYGDFWLETLRTALPIKEGRHYSVVPSTDESSGGIVKRLLHAPRDEADLASTRVVVPMVEVPSVPGGEPSVLLHPGCYCIGPLSRTRHVIFTGTGKKAEYSLAEAKDCLEKGHANEVVLVVARKKGYTASALTEDNIGSATVRSLAKGKKYQSPATLFRSDLLKEAASVKVHDDGYDASAVSGLGRPVEYTCMAVAAGKSKKPSNRGALVGIAARVNLFYSRGDFDEAREHLGQFVATYSGYDLESIALRASPLAFAVPKRAAAGARRGVRRASAEPRTRAAVEEPSTGPKREAAAGRPSPDSEKLYRIFAADSLTGEQAGKGVAAFETLPGDTSREEGALALYQESLGHFELFQDGSLRSRQKSYRKGRAHKCAERALDLVSDFAAAQAIYDATMPKGRRKAKATDRQDTPAEGPAQSRTAPGPEAKTFDLAEAAQLSLHCKAGLLASSDEYPNLIEQFRSAALLCYEAGKQGNNHTGEIEELRKAQPGNNLFVGMLGLANYCGLKERRFMGTELDPVLAEVYQEVVQPARQRSLGRYMALAAEKETAAEARTQKKDPYLRVDNKVALNALLDDPRFVFAIADQYLSSIKPSIDNHFLSLLFNPGDPFRVDHDDNFTETAMDYNILTSAMVVDLLVEQQNSHQMLRRESVDKWQERLRNCCLGKSYGRIQEVTVIEMYPSSEWNDSNNKAPREMVAAGDRKGTSTYLLLPHVRMEYKGPTLPGAKPLCVGGFLRYRPK